MVFNFRCHSKIARSEMVRHPRKNSPGVAAESHRPKDRLRVFFRILLASFTGQRCENEGFCTISPASMLS